MPDAHAGRAVRRAGGGAGAVPPIRHPVGVRPPRRPPSLRRRPAANPDGGRRSQRRPARCRPFRPQESRMRLIHARSSCRRLRRRRRLMRWRRLANATLPGAGMAYAAAAAARRCRRPSMAGPLPSRADDRPGHPGVVNINTKTRCARSVLRFPNMPNAARTRSSRWLGRHRRCRQGLCADQQPRRAGCRRHDVTPHDERTPKARVIGSDPDTDLTVLQIRPSARGGADGGPKNPCVGDSSSPSATR